MKLSICMMVKDEEKYLDICLKSLDALRKEIDSELIIVDTGSTDKTVEIANKYTDKVYFHKWNNNFSEMRNITIQYAKGEWILIFDGDQELKSSEKIIKFLKSHESMKFNAATLIFYNFTDSNNKYYTTSVIPLLYRKNNIKYEGVIHNQPIFSGPIKNLDSVVYHYGYISNDEELMEKKFNRTAQLLIKELEKDPNNIYYRCQLSTSYGMHKDYEKALEEALKAYNYLKDSKMSMKGYEHVFQKLAIAYINCKKYSDVIEVCSEGIELNKNYIDFYFFLGQSQAGLCKYKEAIISLNSYMDLLNRYSKSNYLQDTNTTLYSLSKRDVAYMFIAFCYSNIEEYDKVIKICDCISDDEFLKETIKLYLAAVFKTDSFNYLESFYIRKVNGNTELEDLYFGTLEKLKINFKILNSEYELLINEAFSKYNNAYGMLNKIRLYYKQQKYKEAIKISIEFVNIYDISLLADYYGDILYFLMKLNKDISYILSDLSEIKINELLYYIMEINSDTYNVVKENLELYKLDNFQNIRTNKILLRYLLLLNKELLDENYIELFKLYIQNGLSYIENLYNKDTIILERIHDVKDSEEIFFIYMYNAENIKHENNIEYIRYLRKALNTFPDMKRGIELLLHNFENKINPINNEFEQYKIQVKTTIKSLIRLDKLNEAKSLIDEYEKIVCDDIEILKLKTDIALKE